MQHLEQVWYGSLLSRAVPSLVFLHEGLGCVSAWRDFPALVAEDTGCRALVYSRRGYGKSAPVVLPRPLRYMHEEGEQVLPAVLAGAQVEDAILVGHSDGASIAIIAAGLLARRSKLRGLVLLAPHVFCEEVSVRSIAALGAAYGKGGADDLRPRLLRHHGSNTDGAFRGWCDAWLDPAFRSWNIEEYLPGIQVPVLVIQGAEDQYGTLRQIDAIEAGCGGPVERLVLASCGHSPHRDQPEATRAAIAGFVSRAGIHML